MDPLKYTIQKAMPTGKLAKWQMLLSEFDIVSVTQRTYEPLKTYFRDEDVLIIGESISELYPGWRLFFDRTDNYNGAGIGAALISESGQLYSVAAKLRFHCTNNMAEYEACILGIIFGLVNLPGSRGMSHEKSKVVPYVQLVQSLYKWFRKIEFMHTPRLQNEFADSLSTISSMIKHLDQNYINPLEIDLNEQPAHCSHIEVEPDGKPW
ncbi:uncharacterized protein LOC114075979 [Solanum pennellii]|uniref:Uncharacterized protein LOC114075979 n=1 Tax=Solanum pennellii TaxID=28526 RepID=A0ABM1V2I8_SOLPN|nr:uncharacterized protein LOC114075979 [Solanum pennellii]